MGSLIFDKYEVIRRLAVGGMGEIFLARQTGVAGFDRLAILKSLLPHLAAQTKFVEQFLDEARVAAKLSHPNIVSIYEVGLWEGTYYIAMEYIHGVSLSRVVTEAAEYDRAIPIEVSAQIIHDAAIALDFAHHAVDSYGTSLNVVHRDISPQNIMVRDDGFTKVVDFGIAKAAIVAGRTATGELKGKLRYMPPEQLSGDKMDGRSDQFALGVCFWELCTRQHLFFSNSPVEIMRQIVQERMPPPSELAPSVPPEVDAIIMRMLSRVPGDRFTRCREVSEAIRAFLRNRPEDTSEHEVATYIKAHLGQSIDAVTSGLTPEGENFVIALHGQTNTQTPVVSYVEGSDAETVNETPLAPTIRIGDTAERVKGKGKPGRILAAVGVGFLLAALTWFGINAVLGGDVALTGASTDATAAADASALTARIDAGAISPPDPLAAPSLFLESKPQGAQVFMGDEALGETPVALSSLQADREHTLTLKKRGFVDASIEVRLKPGEERTQIVPMSRLPKSGVKPRVPQDRPRGGDNPPQKAPGMLTIKTTPWTKVEIDGQPRGSTPLFKLKLSPGQHTLRLTNKAKGVDRTQTVKIKSGQLHKLDVDLQSP